MTHKLACVCACTLVMWVRMLVPVYMCVRACVRAWVVVFARTRARLCSCGTPRGRVCACLRASVCMRVLMCVCGCVQV